MLTASVKQRSRLAAGIVLGVTMGFSGFASAQAASTTGNNTDQVQHYENCFGELLSPNHPQDCGTLPTSNTPVPGGLSTQVHDGNATVCIDPGEIDPVVVPTTQVASLDPSWEFVPQIVIKHRAVANNIPYCCSSVKGILPIGEALFAALEQSQDKFRMMDTPVDRMFVAYC